MSLDLFIDEASLWGSLPAAKKEKKRTVKTIDLASILADTKQATVVKSAHGELIPKQSAAGIEFAKSHVFDAYQGNKVLGLTKQLEITSKKDSYKVTSQGYPFPSNMEAFYGAILPDNELMPKVFSVSLAGIPTVVEIEFDGKKKFKGYKKIKDIPPFVQYEKLGSQSILATLGSTNEPNGDIASTVQIFADKGGVPIYKKKYTSLARSQQDKLTTNPGQ